MGHQHNVALDIVNVKLKLVLLVRRVEGRGDAPLPRGGQEGDDELPRVGEGDGDGRASGDAQGGEFPLEGGDLRGQRRVGYAERVGLGRDDDGCRGRIALDGGLEGESHISIFELRVMKKGKESKEI